MQAEQIVSIKCVGMKPTYDIEIDSEDHIFWGNGIATSNSHSYSYGHNAFYTAYCKANIPLKFYEVYLNHSKSKPEFIKEIKELVNDARLHNIEVLQPSLEHFELDFHIGGPDVIYAGIGHIKNVGKEAIKAMHIKETVNNFSEMSWIEVLIYFHALNKKAVVSLISVGALSGPYNTNSRSKMLYEFDNFEKLTDAEIKYIYNNLEKDKDLLYHINKLINNHKINSRRMPTILGIKTSLEVPMYDIEDSAPWIAQTERFYIGVPLSRGVGQEAESAQWVDASCKEIAMGQVTGSATISATIQQIKEHKIKSGKSAGQLMCFLDVEDSTGYLTSVVLFPKEYQEFKYMVVENNSIIASGNVQTRQGERSFIVNKVIQI